MVHPHHLIKRCKVCSDQAPGFNFQGLSCDSCKAFFRRNAHRECTFRCINGTTGQCQVNLINRKKCKACRLFKCIHVAGMQKERIRRGEERSYQQQQQQQQQQTQLSPFDPNFRCLDSNSLQLYEQRQLALVEYAFGAYLDETNLPIVGRLETPSEILNLPGEYIVSTIRFCKRLPAFRSLPAADQLILFKGFFPEKNSVRVSYKYDQEIDGWTGVRDYQEPQQRHGVLVTLKNMRPWACEELVSVFFSFIRQLHEEMEDDVNIRNLIIVSLLFKPRPELSRAEPVHFQHLFYCFLLSRYLEAKYASKLLARKKYTSLRLLLCRVDYIAAILRSIYQKVPAATLAEALKEVYNLG